MDHLVETADQTILIKNIMVMIKLYYFYVKCLFIVNLFSIKLKS